MAQQIYPSHEGAYDAATRSWLETGVEPPWACVWSNGYDVTDRPVDEWPTYARRDYAAGWRPMSGPNADPPSAPGRRTSGMRAKY